MAFTSIEKGVLRASMLPDNTNASWTILISFSILVVVQIFWPHTNSLPLWTFCAISTL